MMDDPNLLFKSLAKLKAIKVNLNPEHHNTQEKYVHEYNETVNKIAVSLEDNLGTFIVPKDEIKPKIIGSSPRTGKRFSSDNWTETQFLLTKVDGLINYLEMLLANEEPKKPMGFHS